MLLELIQFLLTFSGYNTLRKKDIRFKVRLISTIQATTFFEPLQHHIGFSNTSNPKSGLTNRQPYHWLINLRFRLIPSQPAPQIAPSCSIATNPTLCTWPTLVCVPIELWSVAVETTIETQSANERGGKSNFRPTSAQSSRLVRFARPQSMKSPSMLLLPLSLLKLGQTQLSFKAAKPASEPTHNTLNWYTTIQYLILLQTPRRHNWALWLLLLAVS